MKAETISLKTTPQRCDSFFGADRFLFRSDKYLCWNYHVTADYWSVVPRFNISLMHTYSSRTLRMEVRLPQTHSVFIVSIKQHTDTLVHLCNLFKAFLSNFKNTDIVELCNQSAILLGKFSNSTSFCEAASTIFCSSRQRN